MTFLTLELKVETIIGDSLSSHCSGGFKEIQHPLIQYELLTFGWAINCDDPVRVWLRKDLDVLYNT